MHSRRFPRAAFTLVEILVVVAVLAILVALAVPAVGRAVERAATTADTNNLRQIGQGIAAFAAENDSRIPNRNVPVPGTATGGGSDRESFMEAVDRMLPPDSRFSQNSIYNWQRRPIWYSKAFAKMPAGQSFNKNTQYYWGTAWGMNVYLWWNSSPLNNPSFDGNINRAPDRSRLVLVGEKNRNGGHEFDPRTPPSFKNDEQTQYRVSRDGKALYLFADYHIELIEGDQSVATNPTFNRYNSTNRLYYAW
ncbi:MAG: prepilin-type N-terminal cleavage/methylation domain-containing protein [Terrimicrobiaceae bacterium]|nr:prepilin-type N-terminal cleavage/methylation domain-containing protein [Terrimicrobiaceae bacterium]